MEKPEMGLSSIIYVCVFVLFLAILVPEPLASRYLSR